MKYNSFYFADTGTPPRKDKSNTSGGVSENLPYSIDKSIKFGKAIDNEEVPKQEEQNHYKRFFKTSLS